MPEKENLDRKKNNLKMTQPSKEYILHPVQPSIAKIDTRFRKAIAVEKRVAIAFRRFVIGNRYRSIGKNFAVTKSAAVEITNKRILQTYYIDGF